MNKNKIYHNSKDEWYTPLSVIEYVKEQMGHIDLDPATTARNAKLMEIPNFYTEETNGLDKPWYGKVWLNPPFSNKKEWIRKARQEIDNGNCERIFILLPMAFETMLWQEQILGKAIIHIPNRRISFIDGNTLKQKADIPFTSVLFEMNKTGSAPFGSALVELTKEDCSTYKVFKIPERGKQ